MVRNLKSINYKTKNLVSFLQNHDLHATSENISRVLPDFLKLKEIIGNLDMDIHFLAEHLANSFLMEKHKVNTDLSKAVGSSGIDIELKQVVAEIKTTKPYGKNDFGARQKETIRKDLARLEDSDKEFKYLFVIDSKTERILKRKKYSAEYPSVKIVNLLIFNN